MLVIFIIISVWQITEQYNVTCSSCDTATNAFEITITQKCYQSNYLILFYGSSYKRYSDLCTATYKEHSINKIQNGIILLMSIIWKIRNMCFVGNIIVSTKCEFYSIDIYCHSKYPIRNNILFSFTVGKKTWHKCHSLLDVTSVQ